MKSLVRVPTLLWSFITLIVYLSVLVSPLSFKYAGVISFGIPVIILLNLVLLILSVVFRWKVGWVALFLLLCGAPFINVALSVSGDQDLEKKGLKVLNYNLMRFQYEGSDNRQNIIDWVGQTDADVLCFQEFPYRASNVDEIKRLNNYHAFLGGYANSFAIFSTYPIINGGALYDEASTNNIIYTDIVRKEDTLRVYNVHLQSMGINPEKIQTTDGIKNEYEDVTNRFLFGSASRADQLSDLLDHVQRCKYPILVTGDFNDVPFSHNYFRLRRYFHNAFEKKGIGFGITYNNKIPYLRIDNQFYSSEFTLKAFKTFNDVYYSDHFPLIGIYELSN